VKRPTKPRPPVALRASFVSQENCFAVLGVDPRRYLERVVPICQGHVIALGKLRLTPIDVAEEKLREMAAAPSVDASAPDSDEHQDDDDEDEGQPRSVNEVLRAVGRARAPSREP
jgi:hypothetical protein